MAIIQKKFDKASSTSRHLLNQSRLSFATKHDYKRIVDAAIKTLHINNFHIDNIRQLKQKHIRCLVDNYNHKGLSNRSIKNNLSALRFICRCMNKRHVVLDNTDYNLPKPTKVEHQRAIFDIDLSQFPDPYLKFSIALQKEFGLRREECIKFNASIADKGDYIELFSTWTKGGIARDIDITKQSQRELLDAIKDTFPNQSLIPKNASYIQQRKLYDNSVSNSDYKNLHGLRHAYAQHRYKELTGNICPKQGGKHFKDMTEEEKLIDIQAREIISAEMGHSRIQITRIYA